MSVRAPERFPALSTALRDVAGSAFGAEAAAVVVAKSHECEAVAVQFDAEARASACAVRTILTSTFRRNDD
jgi:hypothetical protein